MLWDITGVGARATLAGLGWLMRGVEVTFCMTGVECCVRGVPPGIAGVPFRLGGCWRPTMAAFGCVCCIADGGRGGLPAVELPTDIGTFCAA